VEDLLDRREWVPYATPLGSFAVSKKSQSRAHASRCRRYRRGMLKLSAGEFDELIPEVEERLLALATTLERPVEPSVFRIAALALGQRARTIFHGFTLLVASRAPAAGLPLMRAAVEINLTLRFLVVNPELHSELWAGEGERQSLILLREFAADTELVARHGAINIEAPWVEEREKYIRNVRAKALEAGVVGVGSSGSLLPSMQVIAVKHGDAATREAYRLAYRGLSNDVHTAARAFHAEHFRNVDGGLMFQEVEPTAGERMLNATTFASTLCVLSEPLELGVLDDAVLIKDALLKSSAIDVGATD
jgi:hypothetical protein